MFSAALYPVDPRAQRLRFTAMPLYEYLCQECHQQVEILLRSSTEQPVCPECGSAQLEKQLSLPVAHGPSVPDRQGPTGPCGGSCACFPAS